MSILRAVVALAFLNACHGCEGPPPATEAIAPASMAASEPTSMPVALATVVAQSGSAEVQRGQGEWTPIKVGDRLQVTDAIRTADDGQVDLAVNQVKIRIHEHSEFKVKKVSESIIRGRLTG